MMGGEFFTKAYETHIRGASHDASGLPCQDFSGFIRNNRFTLIVVSDGHGSAPHFRSNIGSELAVQSAKSIIWDSVMNADFMDRIREDPEGSMRHLCNAVIALWRSLVEDHIQKNPFDPKELEIIKENGLESSDPVKRYGATLIACLLSNDIVFGLQIGDGDLVIILDEDGPIRPIPEDEGCFLNRTTSICGSDASMNFRSFTTLPRDCYTEHPVKDPNVYRCIPVQPTSVRGAIVCSDGLTTSFNSEESFLRYCVPACESILTTEGKDNLYNNLVLRSKSNAQDDVSVAIAMRPDQGSYARASFKGPKRSRLSHHVAKRCNFNKKKIKKKRRN